MAMLNLPVAITLEAIMAKMAILTIPAMAIGVINMAILGIQLKGTKKQRSGVKFKAIGPSVQTLSTNL